MSAPGPLDINATVVGAVIELRYASHGDAVRQLRTLRQLVEAAQRLERHGFFAPSTCADAETAADMALMRAAITKATKGEA